MTGQPLADSPPDGGNGGPIGGAMSIDLGTANTLVYVRSRGIVLDEPSVVAIDIRNGEALAFGADAWQVFGSSSGQIHGIRPLRHGTEADPNICKKMVQYFINKVHPFPFGDQRLVICVPSELTVRQNRAVKEAGEEANAKIIEAALAAAIGAGMPVRQPVGNLVVDVGRGATRVAVVALGGIVSSQNLHIAGDELDQAIARYIRNEHGVAIGERTAEEIKIILASAVLLDEEVNTEVRGRDLGTGVPKTLVISTREIHEAISESVGAIVAAVKTILEMTPPELTADIMERGMVLTGGGALLNGLDDRLSDETGMPVVVAENPLHSVVVGGVNFLETFE